ncbi:hypothetical protein AB990_13400 [Alkalihalobacillus pseudalcaliphilus]|nr:hypothetical protein AB990_13400 [Alkalihalobacillus pseudalcaliphilus]
MVDKKNDINAIKFIDVIKYVLIYMKWCNYFFIFFFIASLLLLYIKVNIILYTLTYLLGGILSISIHEYMHILFIKKITNNSHIRIKINSNHFSIIPCDKVHGYKSILIACSGPIVCFLIAVFLYLIKQWLSLESFFMDLLIFSYACHIFSILPFFKDGSMILKEVIYYLLKGGEKQ